MDSLTIVSYGLLAWGIISLFYFLTILRDFRTLRSLDTWSGKVEFIVLLPMVVLIALVEIWEYIQDRYKRRGKDIS